MPLTYTPLVLKGLNLEDPKQLKAAWQQLCDFLNAAFTAPGISGTLNGTNLIKGTAMSVFDIFSGTETVNRTADTAGAQSVVFNLTVTGAINYTLTINNFPPGSVLGLRIFNSSGATRTFTVLINSPTNVSYSVSLIGTGGPVTLSAGSPIANGAAWNGFGLATTGGQVLLFGGVGT